MEPGAARDGHVGARWRGLVVAIGLLLVGGCGFVNPSDAEIKDNLLERWPEFIAAMAIIPNTQDPFSVNSFVRSECLSLGGVGDYGVNVLGYRHILMSDDESREMIDMIEEAWREAGHDVLVNEDGWRILRFEGAADLRISVSSVGREEAIRRSWPSGYLRVTGSSSCARGYSPELVPGYVSP